MTGYELTFVKGRVEFVACTQLLWLDDWVAFKNPDEKPAYHVRADALVSILRVEDDEKRLVTRVRNDG